MATGSRFLVAMRAGVGNRSREGGKVQGSWNAVMWSGGLGPREARRTGGSMGHRTDTKTVGVEWGGRLRAIFYGGRRVHQDGDWVAHMASSYLFLAFTGPVHRV